MIDIGGSGDWRDNLGHIRGLLSATEEEKWKAQVIISSFRQGTPPQENISSVTVGLKNVISAFDHELMRTKDGGCCLSVVHGQYGAGKSHALNVLRERAFNQGFLVSFITLSQRECPLSDLGIVYSKITTSIQSRSSDGIKSIHDILEQWKQSVKKHGPSNIDQALERIRQLHPDFEQAMIHYLGGTSEEMTLLAEKWVTGIDKTKTTAKKLGVQLRATNEDGLGMLTEIASFARAIDYAGICILLDEAEAIPSYSRVADRELCYKNLCQLINPALRISGCYFVYATTPTFFEEAGDLPISSSSKQVIQLPLLNESEAFELSKIIRDLYVIGEGCSNWFSAVDDSQLVLCIQTHSESFPGGHQPRTLVRSLVTALDYCAQNVGLKLSKVFTWCDND